MKTLIIPDIHQSIERVKGILSSEDFDEVVFLGDWVDSHFDPPAVAGFRETCSYLRHLLVEHPLRGKFVFLLGNHDLQYIHLNNKASTTSVVAERAYYCSGFSKSKAREWRRIFFDEGLRDSLFLEKFKICHLSQGWLFSHAGVCEGHIPYGEGVQEFVNVSCREAWTFFRQLNHPRNYLLSDVGQARGGTARIGGPLWLDWREEFISSPHVGKQIVGHTTLEEPAVKGEGEEESWNLDVAGFYGVVEGGGLRLKQS